MDFRGPTIFFCYRWISVIANKGNKRNQLGLDHEFTTVKGGIPLVAGPLERGLTVSIFKSCECYAVGWLVGWTVTFFQEFMGGLSPPHFFWVHWWHLH